MPRNEPEVDPYEDVPEVDIDPEHVDDEVGEHAPADMLPDEDEQ